MTEEAAVKSKKRPLRIAAAILIALGVVSLAVFFALSRPSAPEPALNGEDDSEEVVDEPEVEAVEDESEEPSDAASDESSVASLSELTVGAILPSAALDALIGKLNEQSNQTCEREGREPDKCAGHVQLDIVASDVGMIVEQRTIAVVGSDDSNEGKVELESHVFGRRPTGLAYLGTVGGISRAFGGGRFVFSVGGEETCAGRKPTEKQAKVIDVTTGQSWKLDLANLQGGDFYGITFVPTEPDEPAIRFNLESENPSSEGEQTCEVGDPVMTYSQPSSVTCDAAKAQCTIQIETATGQSGCSHLASCA